MPDLSGYTSKFRISSSDAIHHNGVVKGSKRNRLPVSCAQCRNKKLKCDRGHPCETCVKRGEGDTCTYGPSHTVSKSAAVAAQSGGRHNQAQDRLRNLENLVMQMMTATTATSPATDATSGTSATRSTPEEAAGDGHLRLEGSEAKYSGSTHWSAILDNLQDLKTAIATEDLITSPEQEEERDIADSDTLFGMSAPPTLPQILQQSLPPRVEADRRLSAYFKATYNIIPIIHTGQFQTQYENFWHDFLDAPPLWVSVLFAIMSISASITQVIGQEPLPPDDQPRPSDRFLRASAQCLTLGGYTRPRRFVIEALLLFAQAKYVTTMDPSREVSILFGIITRMAFRMGYHRDPDQFSCFSPFEGEMRRRVWAMCKQFDLMIAFQMGLPSYIPPESHDTKPPRNLLDTDFQEDCKRLPPSRPETEATQILYFVVKTRLMVVFSKICHHALSFGSSEDKDIMALDAEIREKHDSIPEPLRIKPMSQSFADPAHLIMVRINCEFLFQKGVCVLHRKPMARGNEASRKACVAAAAAIMGHLIDVNREFQPGGQLYNDRWMLSSFTMNDFLLAAMVLALAVCTARKQEQNKGPSPCDAVNDCARLDLLRQAYQICTEWGATSKEASRVADALGIMLTRLQPGMLSTEAPQQLASELLLTPLSINDPGVMQNTSPQNQQAHFPSSWIPDGMSPGFNGNKTYSVMDQFDTLMDGATAELDWTVFDQYLSQPNNFEDLGQGWTSEPYSFLGMPQGHARERMNDLMSEMNNRAGGIDTINGMSY